MKPAQPSDLIFATSTLVGPCYCNNLTVTASLWVSLNFVWLRLCQNQATCNMQQALPQALAHANMPKVDEKVVSGSPDF